MTIGVHRFAAFFMLVAGRGAFRGEVVAPGQEEKSHGAEALDDTWLAVQSMPLGRRHALMADWDAIFEIGGVCRFFAVT